MYRNLYNNVSCPGSRSSVNSCLQQTCGQRLTTKLLAAKLSVENSPAKTRGLINVMKLITVMR